MLADYRKSAVVLSLFAAMNLAFPASQASQFESQHWVGNEVIASSTVLTLTRVQLKYSEKYPGKGYAPDLKTLGPGPTGSCPNTGPSATAACIIDANLGCADGTSGKFCTKNNYKFMLQGIANRSGKCCSDYIIFATPETPNAGRKDICAISDQVIRWRNAGAPPSKAVSAAECEKWEPI